MVRSLLVKTECVVSSTPSVTITAEIGMNSGIKNGLIVDTCLF